MDGALDYGNARVRSRRNAIVAGERLDALLGLSLDGLIDALASGPMRAELQGALLRFEGLRRVQEALRLHLAGTLRALLRFYDDSARDQLELLLSRWDRDNLLTLLRGQARRVPSDELRPLLVPAGLLDEAALDQLAREPGPRAMIERMVAWGVPSPSVAHGLLAAWPDYELHDDVARLEHRLVQLHASHVAATLDDGSVDPLLEQALRLEVDARQIVTTMRLWEARERGDITSTAEASHRWGDLAGGRIDSAGLRAAIERPRREDVVATLVSSAPDHLLVADVDRWSRDGNTEALEARLRATIARWVLDRARHADPLSLAIPVGYVFAKEVEMRNLRLVAAVAAGLLPRPVAEARLIR